MNTDGPACSIRKDEASKYVFQVKDRFASDPERYARFLKAFSDIYGSGAPDRSYEERIELIKKEMRDDIFKDHEDLLEGFEAFIKPEGQTVNIPEPKATEETS